MIVLGSRDWRAGLSANVLLLVPPMTTLAIVGSGYRDGFTTIWTVELGAQ